MKGAVKCEPRSVTNQYIVPKHAAHLANALVAMSLFVFAHGYKVYELWSSFVSNKYFKSQSSAGLM